jgi:hypothetical protein
MSTDQLLGLAASLVAAVVFVDSRFKRIERQIGTLRDELRKHSVATEITLGDLADGAPGVGGKQFDNRTAVEIVQGRGREQI